MKKLCIVVPYRDRASHLAEFYPAMVDFLCDQVEYDILVVEQTFSKPFNRAKLLNVGFDYTKGSYDYYCFHDVDMIPINSDYSYCSVPTHLASEAEQFGYTLPYNEYFGGVTIFDRESFQKVNGYSNEYWSWGAEDDDMFRRCQRAKIPLNRKKCRYRSLSHERLIDRDLYYKNIQRLENFDSTWNGKTFTEGLSTLDYSVIREIENPDTPKMKIITVEI
jgi:glycosyltransferase involved in cell wall biosynthesis